MIGVMQIVAHLFVLLAGSNAQKIVLTNDDSWAVAQIRAQYTALQEGGFDVVLSAPAEDQSGTGSLSFPAVPLLDPCEFDSRPAGSPGIGFNASDPKLNYVNAFPVDAARYGIQTLSPKFFESNPDLVVSGPNTGSNTGVSVLGSGTVGAACEGGNEGIPAIAFSGEGASHVSYTTLESDPTSSATIAALTWAELTTSFVHAFFSAPAPFLPSGTVINVNYPHLGNATSGCTEASDVKWVFTRVFPPLLPIDVVTCGNKGKLPTEDDVKGSGGCFASVSVISSLLKLDVGKDTQAKVLNGLSSLGFTCL